MQGQIKVVANQTTYKSQFILYVVGQLFNTLQVHLREEPLK